jgi:hypothetical protein
MDTDKVEYWKDLCLKEFGWSDNIDTRYHNTIKEFESQYPNTEEGWKAYFESDKAFALKYYQDNPSGWQFNYRGARESKEKNYTNDTKGWKEFYQDKKKLLEENPETEAIKNKTFPSIYYDKEYLDGWSTIQYFYKIISKYCAERNLPIEFYHEAIEANKRYDDSHRPGHGYMFSELCSMHAMYENGFYELAYMIACNGEFGDYLLMINAPHDGLGESSLEHIVKKYSPKEALKFRDKASKLLMLKDKKMQQAKELGLLGLGRLIDIYIKSSCEHSLRLFRDIDVSEMNIEDMDGLALKLINDIISQELEQGREGIDKRKAQYDARGESIPPFLSEPSCWREREFGFYPGLEGIMRRVDKFKLDHDNADEYLKFKDNQYNDHDESNLDNH